MIAKEADMFRGLQNQYGDEGSLHVFGECYVPIDNLSVKKSRSMRMKNSTSDFSIGHTCVLELGKPILASWNIPIPNDSRCFKGHFTPRDVEDFKNIARRYANYSDSPIVLTTLRKRALNNNIAKGEWTDNIFPQQYIVRKGARGTPGTIFHTDLDMAVVCKNLYKKHICQVDNILKVNCKVISDLTGIPSLDCSFPFHNTSDTSVTNTITPKTSPAVSTDAYGYTDRINTTRAMAKCVALLKGEEAKNSKKDTEQ